jgi:hypothetical protein
MHKLPAHEVAVDGAVERTIGWAVNRTHGAADERAKHGTDD